MFENALCDRAYRWIVQGRGRNGVESDTKWRERSKEFRKAEADRWEAPEEIENAHILSRDFVCGTA